MRSKRQAHVKSCREGPCRLGKKFRFYFKSDREPERFPSRSVIKSDGYL